MNIRILTEDDAQSYQNVRLRALQTNPEAFGSTYEREVNFSLEIVKERIAPTQDNFVLGAFDDCSSLIGIVTFMRENGVKMRHKANVFAMYVTQENRGKGVAKLLMTELIRMAKSCDGLEQLNLAVVSENAAAKKLYKSLGFEGYGMERNALKFNGRYFDEDLMVLRLL